MNLESTRGGWPNDAAAGSWDLESRVYLFQRPAGVHESGRSCLVSCDGLRSQRSLRHDFYQWWGWWRWWLLVFGQLSKLMRIWSSVFQKPKDRIHIPATETEWRGIHSGCPQYPSIFLAFFHAISVAERQEYGYGSYTGVRVIHCMTRTPVLYSRYRRYSCRKNLES